MPTQDTTPPPPSSHGMVPSGAAACSHTLASALTLYGSPFSCTRRKCVKEKGRDMRGRFVEGTYRLQVHYSRQTPPRPEVVPTETAHTRSGQESASEVSAATTTDGKRGFSRARGS